MAAQFKSLNCCGFQIMKTVAQKSHSCHGEPPRRKVYPYLFERVAVLFSEPLAIAQPTPHLILVFIYPPAIRLDWMAARDDIRVDPRLVIMRKVAITIPPTMRLNSIPVT